MTPPFPHSRPVEGASEAPCGAPPSLDSASPERSGGAAFSPDWEGRPLVSIPRALAISAALWALIVLAARTAT